MLTRGLQHVGIACGDIDEYVKMLGKLFGGKEVAPRLDASHVGFTEGLVKFGNEEGPGLDLMGGIAGVESLVTKFISKRGEGIHHLGLLVSDVGDACKHYNEAGFTTFGPWDRETNDLDSMFTIPKETSGILYEISHVVDEERTELETDARLIPAPIDGAIDTDAGIVKIQSLGVCVKNTAETLSKLSALFDAKAIGKTIISNDGSRATLVQIGERELRYILLQPSPNGNDPISLQLCKAGEGVFRIGVLVSDLDKLTHRFESHGCSLTVTEHSGWRTALSLPEQTGGILYEFSELDDMSRFSK